MRVIRWAAAATCLLAIAAAMPPAGAQEPAAKVTAQRILSTAVTAGGQPITLPTGAVEVTAWIYEIPPGVTLPVHKHPFPRYAYVLSGTLRVVAPDRSQSWDYRPGDFIVEVVDVWHYGSNSGTESVRLLVIDQAEAGRPNTILR